MTDNTRALRVGATTLLSAPQISCSVPQVPPPELIEHIIKQLSAEPATLFNCSLVCRDWCRMAVRVLWRNPLPAYCSPEAKGFRWVEVCLALLSNEDRNRLEALGVQLPLSIERPTFDYMRFVQVLDDREIRRAVSRQVQADELAKVLSIGIVRLAPLRSVVITINLSIQRLFSYTENTFEVLLAVAGYQKHVSDAAFILRNKYHFGLTNYFEAQKAAEHVAQVVVAQRALDTFRLENFAQGLPTIFHALAKQSSSLREAYFTCCTFPITIGPTSFVPSNVLQMVVFNECIQETDFVDAFRRVCPGVSVKR